MMAKWYQYFTTPSKEIAPENLLEMAALISLLRPGTLKAFLDGKNMTQHYADRKANKEPAVPIHPALEDALLETYQIIAYQEQILEKDQEIKRLERKLKIISDWYHSLNLAP